MGTTASSSCDKLFVKLKLRYTKYFYLLYRYKIILARFLRPMSVELEFFIIWSVLTRTFDFFSLNGSASVRKISRRNTQKIDFCMQHPFHNLSITFVQSPPQFLSPQEKVYFCSTLLKIFDLRDQ